MGAIRYVRAITSGGFVLLQFMPAAAYDAVLQPHEYQAMYEGKNYIYIVAYDKSLIPPDYPKLMLQRLFDEHLSEDKLEPPPIG